MLLLGQIVLVSIDCPCSYFFVIFSKHFIETEFQMVFSFTGHTSIIKANVMFYKYSNEMKEHQRNTVNTTPLRVNSKHCFSV